MTLSKVDGIPCTTPEENEAAMAAYLTAEFGKKTLQHRHSVYNSELRQNLRSLLLWSRQSGTT